MGEPALRHQMVCVQCRINVVFVDADGNSHEHMLRSLNNLPCNLEEIRSLQCLEPKIIIVEISVVYDFTVQKSSILKQERRSDSQETGDTIVPIPK